MVKTVFIFGATGNVGSATINVLSESLKGRSDFQIKAGVRDPSSEKAKALGALDHVSLVKSSMADSQADLIKALENVDHLFIVVPGAENRTELSLNAAKAAKEAGVKHTLVITVPSTAHPNTIFAKQCNAIDEGVRKLGIQHTFLSLPLFIDNNWANLSTIKGHDTIYGPQIADQKFTPVAVGDVAAVASTLLLSTDEELKKHAGKTHILASDRYSNNELAAAFSEALGKEIKYVKVGYPDAKKAFMDLGFPEWQVDGIMELFKLIDDKSSHLTDIDLTTVQKITGKKPTSIKEWTKSVAGAFK